MEKKKLKTKYYLLYFTLFSAVYLQAQSTTVDWRGKISIGGKMININCNINLKESAEVFLQQNTLLLSGNFKGESGSKIYLSSDLVTHGFMDISGTASGSTEIIPDVSSTWDGSRIDFVRASQSGSDTSTFQMIDNFMDLKYDRQGSYLFWYIESEKLNSCLPLIVQIANHTLLVNNNSGTNGGYKFVYYTWYKNGQVLKEGAHVDNGGSYYTGGSDLDENVEYTVRATDEQGNQYLSCPYKFIRMTLPVNVAVYPNPVPKNNKVNILVDTEDLLLLQNANVEIYDLLGQYIRKIDFRGQKLVSMDLPAKAGIYILKFKAKNYVKDIKVIVE